MDAGWSKFPPALALISRALNAYLRLDSESQPRLQKLAGKVMTIELLPFHWIFQCQFTTEGVIVQPGDSLAAHTTIRGTPLQMAGVALAKTNRQRFFAEDVIIEGNAELGHQMIAVFDELSIDWEEQLSKIIGDTPAYHLGRFTTRVRDWFQHANYSLTQNINEYVHEEASWLPGQEALQDFFNDIDSLRMDVDRAAAKINYLRQLIEDEESQ